MSTVRCLAFDLGASSGRAILGCYDGSTLTFEEIHRFENVPVEREGQLCWDYPMLVSEIRTGIEKAGKVDSIGIDTWGVDFGLLDADGELVGYPVHYRDRRTEGITDRAFEIMDAVNIYSRTGTQILGINTLFQLLALRETRPEQLERAERLLFMPDLLAHAIGAEPVCERTIASTAQMLDPVSGEWSGDILDAFGIPGSLLLPVTDSGTVTGQLADGTKIITVAGHDTQCAIAAMPTDDPDAAFLSCGTWCLLGTELDSPVLTAESCRLELSNELGANGKVNYLKNIIGLWMIQESRREWNRRGEEYSYALLERLALDTKPLRCFVDPDSPEFAPPGDIPERVREFCRRTGQHVPETVGEVMRCIYESLALKYRYAIDQLRQSTGKEFSCLHILGGGTKDGLLCRMSADATGLEVVAGPVEATALGNIIIQLKAIGAVSGIDEGRRLIAASQPLSKYQPEDRTEWDKAYEVFKKIIN